MKAKRNRGRWNVSHRGNAKKVDIHRTQLMERLGIHDIAGLVRFAIKMGLVTLSKMGISLCQIRVSIGEALRHGYDLRLSAGRTRHKLRLPQRSSRR